MRYPKLRELKEALRALIKGPYTYGFPRVRHVPFERFRGKPEFSDAHCIGCAACVQVCPAGALEFRDVTSDGSPRRVLTVRWDKCICCGQCQANCPAEKGIQLTREFDLATTKDPQELFQTIEKELLLCECCKEIVVPRAQVAWVARRLGPLCFSNASLLLLYLRDMELALQEKVSEQSGRELSRADRIRVLCPRCRREAVLKS